jgi:hypothetical protein
MLLFFLALVLGWFGTPGNLGNEFCEAEHPGLILQPVNTWSNLGFIAVGLLMAWSSAEGHFAANRNSLTQGTFYPAFFSSLAVFLGPGSMAMHATLTHIGGFFDMLSMYLVASFVLAYALQRFYSLKPIHFVLLFSTVLGLCLMANFSDIHFIFGFFGDTAFAFFISLTVVVEGCNIFIRKLHHKSGWAYASLGSILLAFFIWNLSYTGAVYCDPKSIIQGHAIWHLLDAVSVGCLFRYYVSETREV